MLRMLLAALLCAFALPVWAQDLVVRGGTVIDPRNGSRIANAVIVVRDGRIVAVGRAGRVAVPEGAQEVDATGKWVVPGYIDGHIHMFQSGGLYTRPDGVDLRSVRPYELEVASIRENIDRTLRRYLASGVTSVADMGGPMWNFDVRSRSATNPMAPRIFAAGPLISTWKPPVLADVADPPIIAAGSPEEARSLVRAQAAARPDFIKIWFVVNQGETPAQHMPVVRAAIDEAHAAGYRVAVHATELETARAAVEAGADVLVHGIEDKPVDAAFIALLRRRGVIYTSTIDVINGYDRTFAGAHGFTEREYALADPAVMGSLMDVRHLPSSRLVDFLRGQLGQPVSLESTGILQRNLIAVRDAGITIALGTDAGNIGTLPGPAIYREFARMREAGLSPREVLATATVNAARLVGREAELGLVAEGRAADMLVLDGDPLASTDNLSRIAVVIRNGQAFRQDELVRNSPEDVVQRQVNAYNARDLDAFLATYHADARLYAFPDRLESEGVEAMRPVYGEMFANLPALHVEIARRIVTGNRVIDEEVVTGVPNQDAIRAVAIYEVRDGKIVSAHFLD